MPRETEIDRIIRKRNEEQQRRNSEELERRKNSWRLEEAAIRRDAIQQIKAELPVVKQLLAALEYPLSKEVRITERGWFGDKYYTRQGWFLYTEEGEYHMVAAHVDEMMPYTVDVYLLSDWRVYYDARISAKRPEIWSNYEEVNDPIRVLEGLRSLRKKLEAMLNK